MKEYFGYVRVSTAKQEAGASLQAQREAIARYAEAHTLIITRWFEEIETAAVAGRPLFRDMIKQLHRGQAVGVLIHKIDRSARNFRDWAHIGELADKGIDVHFVTESLDFNTRGGRLAADIQAVIAADYIRNLREETVKGLYGRLNQGIYPFRAPIGYLDQGGGRLKIPDPERAPFIIEAFTLYASGEHSLRSLIVALYVLGLRSREGRRVGKNGIALILSNPFYAGRIRIKRNGSTYPGIHQALIPPTLLDAVQRRLVARVVKKRTRHDYQYRGLFRCGLCHTTLVAEAQKRHVYYRCHTKSCDTKCTHAELIDRAVAEALGTIVLRDTDLTTIREKLTSGFDERADRPSMGRSLQMQLVSLRVRMERTTDALVNGLLSAEEHRTRTERLNEEQVRLTEALGRVDATGTQTELERFMALAGNIPSLYGRMTAVEKRELLRVATAERVVCGREIVMKSVPEEQFLEAYVSLLKRVFHRRATETRVGLPQ